MPSNNSTVRERIVRKLLERAREDPELMERLKKQARDNFISRMTASHPEVEYVGQLSREEATDLYKGGMIYWEGKIRGDELAVEYHQFLLRGEIPVVQQFRMSAP